MQPRFSCFLCRRPLSEDAVGHFACSCGQEYEFRGSVLRYDWKTLLFQNFRKEFLLSSVLNNNGFLSYSLLPSGSLSMDSRPEVAAFRDYLLAQAVAGDLLDVGCGPLELPGYLRFGEGHAGRFALWGLDPLDESSFVGTRVVGCAEYLPFADERFDDVVFATSLDHLCSRQKALGEVLRVLKPAGRLLIWMSDRSRFRRELWREEAVRMLRGALGKEPLPVVNKFGRFFVYPDKTVLYKPRGAVDPFHTYNENPAKIRRELSELGFSLLDETYRNKNEVFLSFAAPGRRLGCSP